MKIFKKIITLLLIMVTIVSLVGLFIWNKYGDRITSAINEGYFIVSTLSKDTLLKEEPTIIVDKNGKELLKLNTYTEYQPEFKDINNYLKEGFVVVEDKRFYKHHGVDSFGISRAFFNIILGKGLQGGSTITQQLVKNKITNDSEVSIDRKLTEMVIAQEIEKQYSKNEILYSYLNNIYFGRGAYGIGAASKVYFSKNQRDLTIKEVAVLIGLTNNPSLYDPVENSKEFQEKLELTLTTMKNEGVITEREYNEALKEELTLKLGSLSNQLSYTKDPLLSYIIHTATRKMAEREGFVFNYFIEDEEEYKEYKEKEGEVLDKSLNELLFGGYKIVSDIDIEQNEKLIKAVRDIVKNENDNLEVSVSIIDNESGNVIGMVSGRTNTEYHLPYMSFRQPGSSIKPIIAYSTALEKGKYPQSLISDERLEEYPDVTNWWGDVSNEYYTMREAMNQSLNTPALRAVMLGSEEEMLEKLTKMEFKNLHPYDKNYIISIGGFTNGVSTTDMASAVSTISNLGEYRNPNNILRIEKISTNDVIWEELGETTRVYTPEVSYMLLNMMNTSGQGATVHKQTFAENYPKDQQGAKTGTTDEDKDSYIISVNPYYSVAVWVGNKDNSSLTQPQLQYIFTINRKVQEILLEGKEVKTYKKPDNLYQDGNNFEILEGNGENYSYKKEEEQRRKDSEFVNKERLVDLVYRTVYGLSTEDEFEREEVVKNRINEIKGKEFTSLSDYKEIQQLLIKGYSELELVKRPSAKEHYIKELDIENERIRVKYLELVELKKQAAIDEEELIKQEVEQERQIRYANKRTELEQQLNNEVLLLESMIQTGQNIEQQLTKIDSIIYEINQYGGSQTYYNIITDGQRVHYGNF